MLNKEIPHFIVVGTMKSGTTTLLFHLRNHKKVHLPDRELHFFNKDENFSQGKEWYEKEMLENISDGVELIGEKTPTYSFDPKVAERIYKLYPNTKIIWLFRNPIDRAYSNYLHAIKTGFDYVSFEEAISKEEERMKESIFYGYLNRSLYSDQVERFLKYFPREQMFFMVFEDLLKNPVGELTELFSFLNIRYEDFELKTEFRNKTVLPYSPKMLYYSRKFFGNNSIFHRGVVKLNFFKNNTIYEKMSPSLRRELVERFKNNNQKFANLIDKELEVWNK